METRQVRSASTTAPTTQQQRTTLPVNYELTGVMAEILQSFFPANPFFQTIQFPGTANAPQEHKYTHDCTAEWNRGITGDLAIQVAVFRPQSPFQHHESDFGTVRVFRGSPLSKPLSEEQFTTVEALKSELAAALRKYLGT